MSSGTALAGCRVGLLERDRELGAVVDGLAGVRSGAGRCVIVEDPERIGNSRSYVRPARRPRR
jgi:hypothetical protein